MDYNLEKDDIDFLESVKKHFKQITKTNKNLFKTNTENLFEIFLNNIPVDLKQMYTCNACKNFVNNFGGLVTISDNGKTTSVMWNDSNTPEIFKQAIVKLKDTIESSKVIDVFITDKNVLGQPVTGEFSHLSVNLSSDLLATSRYKSTYQLVAEKKEEFLMLNRALNDYSIDIVKKALEILRSETLYRSNNCLGIAEWLEKIYRSLAQHQKSRDNILWLYVAKAPVGFCHVRASMIGTLLDDIKEGLSFESISARFAEKMNPANYMRSQVAPTQSNINQAEQIVKKLGIENSLYRRYATFDEIPYFVWKNKITTQNNNGGIFSKIISKEKKQDKLSIPSMVMTWEKFQRTILPSADEIFVKVENKNRLMALITAKDDNAPNILKWNNPFSWYYYAGVDGEIKRRVTLAGGRHENNEMRCSLIWDGFTDLDLHVITPNGKHIYFADKTGKCGGFLDIDMNGGSHRNSNPVENIRWITNAPIGHYRFYVHNYCERGSGSTPYKVELEVNNEIFTYNGVASRTGYNNTVFEFNYIRGVKPTINQTIEPIKKSWNVLENSFIKVNGITTSPNTWDNKNTYENKHIFFLLNDCKDLSEGKGRGFFNEMLKSEFHEIRKTLEAFTASTPIDGIELSTASGLGFTKDNDWDLIVKVNTSGVTRIIKIDRWD